MTHLVPIFKKGQKGAVENYRGVAIQSAFPKLLESMVNERLTDHIRHSLSPEQHGFLSGKSTVSNLVHFNHYIKNAMENMFQVDVFYVDFSKAFDRASHSVLSVVFEAFGIKGVAHKFLMSYLTDRLQTVKLRGICSEPVFVTSGVPQGSHIGPTMFLMLVDSLPKYANEVHSLGYADDFKFYATVKFPEDCWTLQRGIDIVSDWSNIYGLDINVGKSVVMTHSRKHQNVLFPYRLGNQTLVRVEEFNDLGVTFDEKGTFKSHIALKSAKGMSMMGFVRRTCVDFRESSTLRVLFAAYVRSQVEYASIVWLPYHASYRSRVERVQRKFSRYALVHSGIFQYDELPSYAERMSSLNLLSLEDRRTISCVMFAHDVLTGRIDAPYIRKNFVLRPERNGSRTHETFIVPFHRTDYAKFEPVVVMIRLLNDLLTDSNISVVNTDDGCFAFNVSRCQLRNLTSLWVERRA